MDKFIQLIIMASTLSIMSSCIPVVDNDQKNKNQKDESEIKTLDQYSTDLNYIVVYEFNGDSDPLIIEEEILDLASELGIEQIEMILPIASESEQTFFEEAQNVADLYGAEVLNFDQESGEIQHL